jgi:preprotein translocase subunit SecE
MASRLAEYLREAREELKKVLWPSRQETTRHTVLVIGVSLAVAAFLGLVDYALNLGLEQIVLRR